MVAIDMQPWSRQGPCEVQIHPYVLRTCARRGLKTERTKDRKRWQQMKDLPAHSRIGHQMHVRLEGDSTASSPCTRTTYERHRPKKNVILMAALQGRIFDVSENCDQVRWWRMGRTLSLGRYVDIGHDCYLQECISTEGGRGRCDETC